MDVQFRLSADHTVRVTAETVDGSVTIRSYEGVDFEKPIHERQALTVCRVPKAQARAIASAIMGCAAEV